MKPEDLVIAAAAQAAWLLVLHHDSGYDRITAVINQPTAWISPPGAPG